MATHKETPRQKMIGMMYLILTALLALNVSKDILNAFSVVNDSVIITNENYDKKRGDVYSSFEKDFAMNQAEVGPFWEKAKIAMSLSSDMVTYIENLRDELISKTENISLDSARKVPLLKLSKRDDYTTPTNILIGPLEDASAGKARELKNKIVEFRSKIIDLVDPKYKDQLKISLHTDGDYYDSEGKKIGWEMHYFYDIPLAADIPILNKFITEVNNAELEVVNALLYAVSADDFKYDRIEAKVLPRTNFLFTGDEYNAEVIVAAYDTSQSPNVYYMRGVDTLPESMKAQATLVKSQNGRVNFSFPVTAAGPGKYAGFVSVPSSSGKENLFHFKSEYYAARPSLTVSATNMNVLYIGVENPLSISVSGIPAEDIFPAISCGTIKYNKEKGRWIAVMSSDCKQAKIDVTARVDGTNKRMGSETFRVKRLPDPAAFVASHKDGFISRESLINAGVVTARMPADFEFDYSFTVVSFRMKMQRGFNVYTYEAQGNKLTDEMKAQIRNTNRGQAIIFEEIMVKGPDEALRELNPLLITIQ